MFNKIENRSIQAILSIQNVLTMKDFENAYQNRNVKSGEVIEDLSSKDERILAIRRNEDYCYLNSRYDADRAAEVWAQQFADQLSMNSIVIVFGLGDGTHIQKLLQQNDKCLVVIYEPCAEVFWNVCGRVEIAELLENPRVNIAVEGICDVLFAIYLETFINYANYQLVKTCALPNYKDLFLDKYRWHMDKYLYAVKRIIFNRNTEILFSKEMIHNILKLSKDVIEQYSVVQLKGIVEKKRLDQMPAVLVSAGPSLDKNIEKLKLIKDSVFIMAVDTALNSVLKHGIIPDMTITVDGHKPLVLFEDERVKKIPVAVSIQSNEKVIATSEAMRFYELSPDEYLGALYREIGKSVEGLPTGGSVANNALSLLVKMGFKTIIFMGQDLAYPGGVRHTFDAYHKENKLIDGRNYFEVEDIYGNKVLTEPNMQLYLKWFEMYIAVTLAVRFIDATEGGALIHGTEIRTMDEVVSEFGDEVYDKKEFWTGIPTYLNEEEQMILKDIIKNIPNHLEELEQDIKECLRLYDKMDGTNRKSNGMSVALNKMLEKISEMNQQMDEDAILYLVKYYAIQADYEVKGNVLRFDEKASPYVLMKDLIENGRTLMNGYLDGIADFRKDLDLFLERFS